MANDVSTGLDVKTIVAYPATRSTKFINKSFTENVLTNIIRVASFKDKYIVDDDTVSIINSTEIPGSNDVLKMVISGYYVEVPISEIENSNNNNQGRRYFYLDLDDLNASEGSGFAGVKELKATVVSNEQYFVKFCSEDELTAAGKQWNDKYVIDVFPAGYNYNQELWTQINISLLKSYLTQFFVVQDAQPENTNVLWINRSKSYVMNVYDNGQWVEIGAVYKSTNTAE